MNWFIKLITNPFLITGISSWAVAQVAKVIINAIVNRKLDWQRLFGDGGMPSGHSATVVSLATICALICGTDSHEFAVSAILAVIVCHDAMCVRQEAGKHAVILNEIIASYKSFNHMVEKNFGQTELKEFLGHTPLQVIVGGMVGFSNACWLYWFFFR